MNILRDTGNVLWQLPIIGGFKGMSYCIKTADNLHFVIDGGDAPEVEYLKNFINDNLDGRVDAWFITHPHKSHTEAFQKIVQEESVKVEKIVYSYNDTDIIAKKEPHSIKDVEAFYHVVKHSKIPSLRVKNGERHKFGKCIVKIIIPDIVENDKNFINDKGVIYKFNFKNASILFLGDVGKDASLSLLSNYDVELKSDIVQMSNHGFYGVSNDLYDVISPGICLWPTRKELWPGDAEFLTGETREIKNTLDHMIARGVDKHFVAGLDGLSAIKF